VALREGPQTLKAHFHKMAVVTMYNTILSNHAPSTDMHTLSLHDALPISCDGLAHEAHEEIRLAEAARLGHHRQRLAARRAQPARSEEHTSELQSRSELVCRLLREKNKICTVHVVWPASILSTKSTEPACR